MTRILSHCKWWTHLDELLAIYLIERYLNETEDSFLFFNSSWVEEANGDEIMPGDIAIGIGKGELDDKNPDGMRKDKCVARLVAEKFGLTEKYPEIEALINDVEHVDENGASGKLPFSQIVQDIAKEYGKDVAIEVSWYAFNSRIEQNRKIFHNPEVKAMYEAAPKRYIEICGEEKEIVILQIYPNSPNVMPYAFWKGAVCAIIYNLETGNTQIIGNKKFAINLKYVSKHLKNREPNDTWYFHPPMLLLNGSHTHPNIRPTEISLEEIIEIVCFRLTIC